MNAKKTPQLWCRTARVLVRISAGDDPRDIAKRFGFKSEQAVYAAAYRNGIKAHRHPRAHIVSYYKGRNSLMIFQVPFWAMKQAGWHIGDQIHAEVDGGKIILEPIKGGDK